MSSVKIPTAVHDDSGRRSRLPLYFWRLFGVGDAMGLIYRVQILWARVGASLVLLPGHGYVETVCFCLMDDDGTMSVYPAFQDCFSVYLWLTPLRLMQ